MQEKQVTIGEQSFKLEEPFLVLATQNPIEQEGTYPLPEAQVDRFMLKLKIGYPSRAEERQILDLMARTSGTPFTNAVVDPSQILNARKVINDIYVDDKVKDYIVDLVCATRDPEAHKIEVKEFIQLGASPARHNFARPRSEGVCISSWPWLCHTPGMLKPSAWMCCGIALLLPTKRRLRKKPAKQLSKRFR
jgi:MoxR-like ATPase